MQEPMTPNSPFNKWGLCEARGDFILTIGLIVFFYCLLSTDSYLLTTYFNKEVVCQAK